MCMQLLATSSTGHHNNNLIVSVCMWLASYPGSRGGEEREKIEIINKRMHEWSVPGSLSSPP